MHGCELQERKERVAERNKPASAPGFLTFIRSIRVYLQLDIRVFVNCAFAYLCNHIFVHLYLVKGGGKGVAERNKLGSASGFLALIHSI